MLIASSLECSSSPFLPAFFATAEVVLGAKECAGTERGLRTEDGMSKSCELSMSMPLASRFLWVSQTLQLAWIGAHEVPLMQIVLYDPEQDPWYPGPKTFKICFHLLWIASTVLTISELLQVGYQNASPIFTSMLICAAACSCWVALRPDRGQNPVSAPGARNYAKAPAASQNPPAPRFPSFGNVACPWGAQTQAQAESGRVARIIIALVSLSFHKVSASVMIVAL